MSTTPASHRRTTPKMQRGRTEVETCTLNGWGVGTRLRGSETWDRLDHWTTIVITALGRQCILAHGVDDRPLYENTWTLRSRDWFEVEAEDCHCGRPVTYGYDGDQTHHRGMCRDCDLVRCDAYPMECPHREDRRA